MSPSFKNVRDEVPEPKEGVAKAGLFRSAHLLLGLNRLEPGAEQAVHSHEGQDKFYQVLEGVGRFTVGDEVEDGGPGEVVWAEAGVPHGVRNVGESRLLLLVGIAPAP